ncbi:MAG: carboxypeptidase regulatory-like domain-containing protein [Anaerolineae bacterium]|nr:carboxypeptidase regulatory-like domain-containing protein [Anaerolineae bacterium]
MLAKPRQPTCRISTVGNVTVTFNVPAGAVTGTDLGARFRLSTAAGLTATDVQGTNGPIPAPDGEVEDYLVQASAMPPTDYGDAPDTGAGTGTGNYNTTAADNGPSHTITANLYLGSVVADADSGTLQNAAASADDNDNTDDEDGLPVLPAITTASTSVSLDVNYTNSSGSDATVACWIDFNRDGDFADTGESASAVVTSSGTNPRTETLVFSGFSAPVAGDSYIRCRIANAAGEVTTPTGAANTGEVEDQLITISQPLDYGDAPDTGAGTGTGNYNTTAADNGPSHVITNDLYLGSVAGDNDSGTLQNAAASADDNDNTDDEEAITVLPTITSDSTSVNLDVAYTNSSGSDATIACWIDFNRDGDFTDTGESASAVVTSSGTNPRTETLVFSGFSAPVTGDSYIRCRIANASGEVATPTGAASTGEVEDYLVEITEPICPAGHILNVASVTGNETDPDLTNNSDSVCTEVEPLGAIGNYVWVDENSDGYQDAGEPGIPGVIVKLYDAAGTLVDTVVTDANGGYLFDDLPAGTYYVDVEDGTDSQPNTLPFSMTQTPPSTLPGQDYGNQDHGTTPIPSTSFTGYPVTIGAGETNLTADFGYNSNPAPDVNGGTGDADIGDRIWIDANGNGVQDAGELGIPGVTLTLYYDPDGDGVYDTPYPGGTTTTDAYGRYMFEDLPPDGYVVVVDSDNFAPGNPLAGYTQTGDPDHYGTSAANAPAGTAGDNQTTVPVVLAPGDVFLNADFGYQPPMEQNNTVGDTVWFDVDGDGFYEPNGNDGNPATTSDNEYGIPGVTVSLIRDTNGDGTYDPVSDPIVATTITDENGEYLFNGVPDGNYIVWVNDTDDVLGSLFQSGDPDDVLDDMGATDLDAAGVKDVPVVDLLEDFGYTRTSPVTPSGNAGIIGDTVFYDANNNDTPDPGEGIGGVTVQLYDDGGNLIGSTVTDANGNYLFTDLPVDGDGETYTVVVVTTSLPPGMTNTYDPDGGFDSMSDVTISTASPIDLDQDFGYQLPGTAGEVGDQVWLDTNADGVFDTPTEPGIGNVTLDLVLDLNGNGVADPGEPVLATETTAANGTYLFDNLPVDDGTGDINYVVVVTDKNNALNGLTQTFGTPNTNNNGQMDPYGVTLSAGSPTDYTADFSYARTLGTIGDTIFLDANSNGTPDPGEGIGGVVVNLYDDNGDLVATTVTDENGLYLFDDLIYGDYTVEVDTTTLPPGLDNTVDPDGGFDSMSDVTVDSATPVNLDQDFGYEPAPGSNGQIGDQVWLDTTPDGVFNSGTEPGIGNVTLDLIMDLNGNGSIDPGEPVIGTATTAADGTYLFTGLPTVDNGVGPAGSDYIVTVTDVNGALTGLSPTVLGTPGVNNNNQSDPYAVSLTVGSPSNLTADFGYVYAANPGSPLGAIGDTVWIDANNNGIQDPGEPGVGGVLVNLTGPGGPLSTTTNPDGTYLFSDLPLGVYTVTIDPTNFNVGNPLFGYVQTYDDDGLGTPNQSTTTIGTGGAAPLVDLDQDFGYRPNPTNSNTVGDTIWLDVDGDGIQDDGEPGIPNVTVELRDQSSGDVLATMTTDENGEYLFTGLPDGTYTIVVTDENGVLANTVQTGDPDAILDNQSDVSLDPGGTNPVPVVNLDQDFGYQPALGAIGDTVWVNQNGNTTQDPGEPGVGGVTVELLDSGGNVIATTTTAPDGTYLFTGLPAGDYTVRIPASNFGVGQPLEGYTPNYDDDGGNDNESDVTLTAGEVNLDQDFGYQAPAAQNNSVGDYVWLDANANGTGPSVPPADGGAPETQGDTGNPPDNGETGIAGVTVALVDSNGDVIATTTTDGSGYYLFTGVPDGTYDVVITDEDGVLAAMTQTYDDDGLATPNQSTVDLDSGSSSATPVANRAQDFGYVPQDSPINPNPTGTIGDTIFWDTNGNGSPDPGEGLPGVEVTIEFPDGSTQTTTTDENGVYIFSNLPVDGDGETYTVTVNTGDIPAGLTNTVDPDGGNDSTSVTTISSGAPTDLDQDFGYAGSGTVGNLVWLDTNADGFNDGPNGPDGTPGTDDDEPGIEGVTLALYYDANGNGNVDPGEPVIGTTTTDSNGNYQFSGLTTDDGGGDASYVVKVTDEDGILNGYWHSLRPAGNAGDDNYSQVDPYGQGDFNLTPGSPSNQTGDFGYYVQPAALGNRTWIDTNQNGIQDPGEPPLQGIPVTLTITYPNDPTPVVLHTVSDANGFYDFGNLLLDEDYNIGGAVGMPTYELTFGQISIYQPTLTGQGTPLDDNNWDGSTPVPAIPVQGETDTTLMPANPNGEQDIASYDAGYYAVFIPPDGPPQYPDMGDLPEPLYPTSFANNGPIHIIDDLYMGVDIDADNDGQPDATATGDDGIDIFSIITEKRADEDGVTVTLSEWDNGPAGGEVSVFVTDNGVGDGGWLKAWFDFNADGVFDTIISQAVVPGMNTIPVDVPEGTFLPDGSLATGAVGVYARFRLFDSAVDPGISYTGLAFNGEVEDYFWSFSPTAVTMQNSVTGGSNVTVVYLMAGMLLALLTGFVLVRRRDIQL